jgi:hypothetical protein
MITYMAKRVFISYRIQEPDRSLAQEFYESLQAAGHQPFMAGESIGVGENWAERIDRELQEADYLLLFLSEQSAYSDMVIEEVRRARELRSQNPQRKPIILPIRVNLPFSAPLNYDLRSYLQRIQQRQWNSAADTPIILQEILALLAGNAEEIPVSESDLEVTQIVPPAESSEILSPPLPVAEPELPRGTLSLTSVWYVERSPIESNCYQGIVKPGALIQIKAPRQMGKTSLMARILAHAKAEGCRTVYLDFQEIDGSVFEDLNRFLYTLCEFVADESSLSSDTVNNHWNTTISDPKRKCTKYFQNYLLENFTAPLVLALDEVDRIFANERVTKEFFPLLRSWNEAPRRGKKTWEKLRLLITYSTEPYAAMDIYSSPLENVGLNASLQDFSPAQVLHLARKHGLLWTAEDVKLLSGMIGEHPYLVRLALYQIARQEISLSQLLQEAPTEAGIYGDHLRRHLWNLEQHHPLMEAFKQVLVTELPVRLNAVLAFKLKSMGLVNQVGNEVTVRYNIYRRYFRECWRID